MNGVYCRQSMLECVDDLIWILEKGQVLNLSHMLLSHTAMMTVNLCLVTDLPCLLRPQGNIEISFVALGDVCVV